MRNMLPEAHAQSGILFQYSGTSTSDPARFMHRGLLPPMPVGHSRRLFAAL